MQSPSLNNILTAILIRINHIVPTGFRVISTLTFTLFLVAMFEVIYYCVAFRFEDYLSPPKTELVEHTHEDTANLTGSTKGWSNDTSVQHILDRPLFVVNRRPYKTPAAPLPSIEALPRLAGIVVNGGFHAAIFEPNAKKPIVAFEGMNLEGFTITKISMSGVLVKGFDQELTLVPTYDSKRIVRSLVSFRLPSPANQVINYSQPQKSVSKPATISILAMMRTYRPLVTKK